MKWEPYVAWYVGCPRAGKTYKALENVREDQRRTGWPILVVDSTEAGNFDGLERVASCEEAMIALLSERKPIVAWTPAQPEEVEALARGVRAAGRIHLLIDEAAFWLGTNRGRGGALLRLLRAYRHSRVSVHCTTQHFSGDVSAEALACAPAVYVFRTTSSPALDKLEREYGLDRAQVSQLPERRYLFLNLGF